MVLGSELGSISSGKAKKNLAKKKCGGPPCHASQEAPRTKAATRSAMGCAMSPMRMAMCVVRGVAGRHAAMQLAYVAHPMADRVAAFVRGAYCGT